MHADIAGMTAFQYVACPEGKSFVNCPIQSGFDGPFLFVSLEGTIQLFEANGDKVEFLKDFHMSEFGAACRTIMLMGIDNLIIPEGTTEIGEYAFFMNNYLTSIKIPSTVKRIGLLAFSQNRSLKTVDIFGTRLTIGQIAFEDCHNLERLCFHNMTIEEVKKISYYPWGAPPRIIYAGKKP